MASSFILSSGGELKTTDASGTNTVGGNIIISAGKGTGSAAGGNILFKTSPVGGAGSSVNDTDTKMTMNGSGLVFAGGSKVNLPYTGSNWGQIGRDVQNGGGGIEFRWASGNGDYICMHNFVNINHTSTSHTDRLNVNGNISATGTISGSSDDRIKYNEVNINGASALSIINQLQPQKYEKLIEYPDDKSGAWIPTEANWPNVKDDYKWGLEVGLIAQDIQAIPELSFAVDGEEVDSEGNQTPLSLNYNNIFTYHIAATKELSSQLDVEKTKTATLETQVADLLSRVSALESS